MGGPSSSQSLGTIHQKILDLLKANPDGLTIYEIREGIPGIEIQQHLDKRVRELRYEHNVPLVRREGKSVYAYKGPRTKVVADSGAIPSKLRAEILEQAKGRCQMCGRTIAKHQIELQIDHKTPRSWGGATQRDNLWAICQLCNGGKRDFFATFDDTVMRKILAKQSVYERILETLRLNSGKPTPSWLLQFVANYDDWQDDWQKRLRELRYPVIGIEIDVARSKNEHGRWETTYTLVMDRELPSDHKYLIKQYERDLKKKRPSRSQ